MNLMTRWLRPTARQRAKPALPATTSERDATRRELVAMAVNDSFRRHGLHSAGITAETSPASTVRKERGLHLRLVMREWKPELLPYLVAVQKAVRARVTRLDPLASEWLTGISWKFDLVDDTACPALPRPDSWRGAQAAGPDTARPAASGGPARGVLQRLIGAGDRAFGMPAGATANEFSATLPMLPDALERPRP